MDLYDFWKIIIIILITIFIYSTVKNLYEKPQFTDDITCENKSVIHVTSKTITYKCGNESIIQKPNAEGLTNKDVKELVSIIR